MKKQRMVLLGSLALVILLSVVLIILMTSPQQEQSQESSQTDQQQELELLSMTVEQINTIYTSNNNLNIMTETLDSLHNNILEYLEVKSTDSLNNYYYYELYQD